MDITTGRGPPSHTSLFININIISGPFLAHFSRISQRHAAPHAPYAVHLSPHAYRMLIGACNPMLCPIHVFLLGL